MGVDHSLGFIRCRLLPKPLRSQSFQNDKAIMYLGCHFVRFVLCNRGMVLQCLNVGLEIWKSWQRQAAIAASFVCGVCNAVQQLLARIVNGNGPACDWPPITVLLSGFVGWGGWIPPVYYDVRYVRSPSKHHYPQFVFLDDYPKIISNGTRLGTIRHITTNHDFLIPNCQWPQIIISGPQRSSQSPPIFNKSSLMIIDLQISKISFKISRIQDFTHKKLSPSCRQIQTLPD